MDEQGQKNYRLSIIGLVLLILAAAVLVWWLGLRGKGGGPTGSAPPPTPNPKPAVVDVVLSNDLRVLSGKVTGKTASLLVVEWWVPKRTDLEDIQKFSKKVSWSDKTVFERVLIGSPGAIPEKIKSSDVRVGQSVMITTVAPVQSGDSLEAFKVQVLALPKL